jgi:hypothetical protein
VPHAFILLTSTVEPTATFTGLFGTCAPSNLTVTVYVPKSPVKVAVGSTVDVSKIKAWGTGLEYGVAGKHAEFFVQCKGASLDNLSVGIEGPGEAKVEIENQDDGTVRCRYLPMSAGAYVIHIMYDEIDINNSPYTANISPPADMSKVYAEGRGLTSAAMAQTSCKFTVFTKGSGAKGKCTIKVVDFNGDEVESTVKDNGDGTFACAYVPKSAGKYVISIWFMDEMMPKAPITVDVQPFCDPSKVKATGPGLAGGKAEKPATSRSMHRRLAMEGSDSPSRDPLKPKFNATIMAMELAVWSTSLWTTESTPSTSPSQTNTFPDHRSNKNHKCYRILISPKIPKKYPKLSNNQIIISPKKLKFLKNVP